MYYLNTDGPVKMFGMVLRDEIYVDKSLLAQKVSQSIGTWNRFICITRPRRFGKTMNANMLGAYYTKGFDTSSLFTSLALSQTPEYKKHLNCYNVVHIDFSARPDFCDCYEDYIRDILSSLRSDLANAYPALKGREYSSISRMFQETGDSFIFIFDEWDSVFCEPYMTRQNKEAFLRFLKGLLKDKPYVALAYMTGVLPIAKYSSGSELNMFREYNFMNDQVFKTYFGLTAQEVKILCDTHKGVSYEELKQWYDGYYMSDSQGLFNPRSVCCALAEGVCRNYWTETGPMNEIADCIEHNVSEVREDIVHMVAGIPIEIQLDGYSAAEQSLTHRNEILSAMVVYGFLSYNDGVLRIPNHELMEKFQQVLSRDSMGEVKQIVETSKKMLEATLAMDEQTVAHILEEVHDREIPFLVYNDENALSCVITLCYLYARKDYRIEREEKTGKGYCDYIFYPKKAHKPAILLELKVNESPENALMQIHSKGYLQKAADCGEVLLVGIGYDKKQKLHQCRIEKQTPGHTLV
ncbi:MAG: AAA family ATPase [Lachnospiraceae bacterium]|nr:AAA family ATPase [Lachnospiraceae bacterium]